MEIVQKAYNLCATYTQSEYCPSLSKVVKSVACVAGAILGWRYAPKITLTIIAGTALYYGAKFFQQTPPKTPKISIVEEHTHLPNPEQVIESPAPPPILPQEEPEHPAITSEEEFKAFLGKSINNPLIDITQAFDYLYQIKPESLDILTWNPADGVVPQEEAFMESVYFLSATLEHHKDILSNFIPRFKEKKGPLSQPELRQFIIKIIFLSRYEHMEKIAKIKDATHPLTPIPFGPASYPHLLACQQWYEVTHFENFIKAIDDLETCASEYAFSAFSMINSQQALQSMMLIVFITGKITAFKQMALCAPAQTLLYTEIDGISSLKQISDWVSSVLNGKTPAEDIVSLFSFLSHNQPKKIDISLWNPSSPQTKKFNETLQPQFDSPVIMGWLLSKYYKDPRLSQEARQSIESSIETTMEAIKNNAKEALNSEQIQSIPPPKILTFLASQLIKEAEEEASFMEIVFSLAALLEIHPLLANTLSERLKPLNDPGLEVALKDKHLRAFIIRILWLSKNMEAVEKIIIANNPTEAPKRIETFQKLTHPTEPHQEENLYTCFLANTVWYNISKKEAYLKRVLSLQQVLKEAPPSQQELGDLFLLDSLKDFITPKIERFLASISEDAVSGIAHDNN